MSDEAPVQSLRQELYAMRGTLLLQIPHSIQVLQALIGNPEASHSERLAAIRLQWRLFQLLLESEHYAERMAKLQAIAEAVRYGPTPTTAAALARTLGSGVQEGDVLMCEKGQEGRL